MPAQDASRPKEVDMAPILIIPGLGGSGEHHWQTHLEQAFPQASRVHQADWNRPDRADWLARLAAAIAAAPGAMLVAHSLGCALVAHLASAHRSLAIGAALLVAPADVDDANASAGLAAFAPMPRRPFGFPSLVVASRNDPYMRFDRAVALARNWNADFLDAGAAGHINVASGFGHWPAAESLVDALSRGARATPSPSPPPPPRRTVRFGYGRMA
jgi:predicted alpha/beta hydrolase family esterase